MELFAQAVLQEIRTANNDLRRHLASLSGEALSWRPAGEETNSLYVLATHIAGVQRFMVALAAGVTVPRDRASEFRAQGDDAGTLLAEIDHAEREVEGWLSALTPETLAESRTYLGRPLSAAACLANAVRHLGEHVGHAGLTRQLWERATRERPA